jgi:hypothetical protein
MSNEQDDEEYARSQRRVHLIALLVLGGIWVANVLGSVSRLQDCVMFGRTNCVRFN